MWIWDNDTDTESKPEQIYMTKYYMTNIAQLLQDYQDTSHKKGEEILKTEIKWNQ